MHWWMVLQSYSWNRLEKTLVVDTLELEAKLYTMYNKPCVTLNLVPVRLQMVECLFQICLLLSTEGTSRWHCQFNWSCERISWYHSSRSLCTNNQVTGCSQPSPTYTPVTYVLPRKVNRSAYNTSVGQRKNQSPRRESNTGQGSLSTELRELVEGKVI